MAFFTSLIYYRPCPPPAVTADDLARFIAGIRDAGLLTGRGLQSLHVKFGEAIDRDAKGTTWEDDDSAVVSIIHEIEWDLDLKDPTGLQGMIDALAADPRPIYRADVSLGTPIAGVLESITRPRSPENDQGYGPDTLSVAIGPVRIHDLSSEAAAVVGWLGLSFSGYGYLYPWTLRDCLHRLEAGPEVQRLMDLCRTFWPVPRAAPDRRTVKLRKKLGNLWPYDDLDRQWDWYWGVQESG